MTEPANLVYESIDRQHADKSAATRRQIIGGASALLGSMGLLGLAERAGATHRRGHDSVNSPENIANIAATAEVLATIVNTVGFETVPLDDVTKRNVEAAAREELIHYQVLVSDAIGAKPVTKRIWVPDSVFASRENFLNALVIGDQIFINAYMIGTTVFARSTPRSGGASPRLARIASEFMGAEAVHRALALQSLGKLGNDRVFMKFTQKEEADVPTRGRNGFQKITSAVKYLEEAGFGFGKQGAGPGKFYDFDTVSARTPDPPAVNTRTPA
ncbi:MAG: hypothetical protein M3N47_04550 [Chloroflexota bacterium]|nr:hypothetical protein [Chloroflexota bacterium]